MRAVLLVVALFAVSFLGVRVITLEGLLSAGPTAATESFEERSRRELRDAVIETAAAFRAAPCNEELERRYLAAAADYARAFTVLGGCPTFPACRDDNTAMMANAKRVFASPADARVRDAMRAVHDMGIRLKDYPGGLGLAVDYLSGSTARREGEFICKGTPTAGANAKSVPPGARVAASPAAPHGISPKGRDRLRDNALQGLRRPGPALCAATERDRLVSVLNLYYAQRDVELGGLAIRSHAEQVEISAAWSTPIDRQIDGLVREFYTEGYLQPGDLRASDTVDQVLSGARPRHSICADVGKG